MPGVRGEFFSRLAEAMKDENTYFLTADLGYSYAESILKTYPDRAYNVGIAEVSMIGVAKGLSEAGKTVYCYSMAPFLIFRPLEFLRLITPAGGDIILVGYQTTGQRAGRSHICGFDDLKACEIAGIELCTVDGAFTKGNKVRYLRLEA